MDAIVLGFLVCLLPLAAHGQNGTVPVTVVPASVQPVVNTAELSGTVLAARASRISAAVGGLVEAVEVDLGDKVEPGQPLIRLDSAAAQHEVRQAEAAVAEAEAQLADTRRRLNIAQRLFERDNIAENELEAREIQVQVAAAAVERLQAAAAYAQELLARHTVKAPYASVVARKSTEVGEWVSPGSVLVELITTEDLWVDIPIPQRYFPQLEDGTPVGLRFDALPGRQFEAQWVALVPVSDPTARTFILRVRPAGDDIPLTPGMSARATLALSTGEQGIVIPRDAVIRYPDGRTTVWIVDSDSTVSERKVELGRAFEGQIHVTSGLTEDQCIVVRGNELLRDGQRVRVTNGNETGPEAPPCSKRSSAAEL